MKKINTNELTQMLFSFYSYLLKYESEKKAEQFYKIIGFIINPIVKNNVNSIDVEVLNSLIDYNTFFNKKNYYEIKDILNYLFDVVYQINNFYEGINYIRSINNFKYDDRYLKSLLIELDYKFNKYNYLNDRFDSLFNLLSDNNYLFNNIGTRINIIKYLLDKKVNLQDINILKVKNSYLSDKFSFLAFKNDKSKKNPNKLFFIDNMIIINSIDHDNIYSIVFYHKDNTNINNVMNNYINDSINDIKYLDTKKSNYTWYDKEYQVYSFISDLINVLKVFDNTYNDVDVSVDALNDNNIYEYLNIIKNNYNIYYRYEKLLYKYNYVFDYLTNIDEFKSNDISLIKYTIDSYKYKIKLSDYFLNP